MNESARRLSLYACAQVCTWRCADTLSRARRLWITLVTLHEHQPKTPSISGEARAAARGTGPVGMWGSLSCPHRGHSRAAGHEYDSAAQKNLVWTGGRRSSLRARLACCAALHVQMRFRPDRPALASSDAAAVAHHELAKPSAEGEYRRGVAALAAANCAHFFSVCSIFPYAGFLAVDNGYMSCRTRIQVPLTHAD